MQKAKDNKAKMEKSLFVFLVLLYPMMLFLVFYVCVNFNSILLSFKTIDYAGNQFFCGLENYKKVFKDLLSDYLMRKSILNSVKLFFLTMLIGFPLEITFSFYLFNKKFLHKTIRFCAMLPSIVSGMIMCLIFQRFVEDALPTILQNVFGLKEKINLLSTYDTKYSFGTIVFYMLWTGFSSSLIIYPNAMNAINPSVIESANLDGCSSLKMLFYIILPLIMPTITTFVVTGVSGMLMLSGPLLAFWYYSAPSDVYTSGYYLFVMVMRDANMYSYPYASAIGIVFTLFSIPVTFLVKYLLERIDPQNER